MNKDNILLITLFIVIVLLFAYFFFKKHKEDEIKKHMEMILKDKSKMDSKIKNKQELAVYEDKEKINIVKQKCQLDEDINSGKCQESKEEICPMGCYKQCTNNVKPLLKNCDCHDRNSLLCNKKEKLSEKCLKANDMLHHKLLENEKIEGKDTKQRVNNFTAKISVDKKCSCKKRYQSLRHMETKIRDVPQIVACK